MAATVKTAISIHKSLFEQAESLAHELNVSKSELFGLAIETFIKKHQNQILLKEINKAYSDEPDTSHPHVVVQNNVFNASRINTVIVCALSSNIKRAEAPGNVLLEKGEANLSKQSAVLVSKIFTVDKTHLGEYIGTLSERRDNQILESIYLMTEIRNLD